MDLHRTLSPPEGANDDRNLRSFFVGGFVGPYCQKESRVSQK